jgi:curved DNA-binding protein CbpA
MSYLCAKTWRSQRLLVLLAPFPCHAARSISTSVAKSLLGLTPNSKPTMKELRFAYFRAAKQCHPDVKTKSVGPHFDEAIEFRRITEAFERLMSSDEVEEKHADLGISKEEELEYREACKNQLGLPAEIVEESKQNPIFRHWLAGNTDAAHYWRSFFSGHGGLAQKLRPPAALIESKWTQSESRRPRRSR